MESLGEILKRTRIGNTSKAMDASSGEKGTESEGCPICHDRGWVTLDVPLGHPDFGKAFPCQCTLKRFEQERLSRLERYSNLGPLTSLTFDNLSPKGRNDDPQNQQRFSHCYEIARAFAAQPKGWLVLTGPSGCGKTHMAAAIANQCLRHGVPAFFADVPDLLDHLRATFSPDSDVSYDELFEQVRNAPLLVLDGLGTHSSTPWAEEKLFQILNHRFNAQLPTVITAISLNRLDERLRTRLKDPALAQELELGKPQPLPFRQIGIPDAGLLSAMSFKNFDTMGMNADEKQRESLRIALKTARGFAESPEGWLVLAGPHGCGKTHLAAAIANQQPKARPAVFFTVPELLDHLRATFYPESRVTYDEVFEGVKTCPLLILDDLGTELGTPWAREKLYQILNYRYNARLPTVITTRYTLEELEKVDPRLSSRMGDPRLSIAIVIDAPDYRGQVRPRRRKA